MLEAALLAPLLLLPVAALLFLNLRLSRRLSYPHDLLLAEQRRGAASFLFRSLRTYYDTLIDAAIALVLAFALASAHAPGTRHRSAVVIDTTRSMRAGQPGSRPLDRALQRLLTDPALGGAEPFAIALDPASARTRLVPLAEMIAGLDAESAVRRIEGRLDFFAVDYGELASLRSRGYGKVTLLTDRRRFRPKGFEVVESGFTVSFAAYPAAARYDRAAESWLVALVETGPRAKLTLRLWDGLEQHFAPLKRERYRIEEGSAGRRIRFSDPGLYLVSLPGPYGQPGIDLPLLLRPAALDAAAGGSFSERMLSAFPAVAGSAAPALVLLDQGVTAPAGKRRFTTALVPESGRLIIGPDLTGGALVAAGAASTGGAGGADLALGPSSLASDELVLAYDAILRAGEQAFATAPPAGTRSLVPVGSAYLARTDDGLVPLIPPASAFFETPPQGAVRLPPPPPPRLAWFLALIALAALKLFAWTRLKGKRLFARS